jgi:hypothetical protein
MGKNEDGIDCGGMCRAECGACRVIEATGPYEDRLNIVFVPDLDYNGNLTKFLADVRTLIDQGFFAEDVLAANKCRFNFFYYPEAGDYQPNCTAWLLPANFSAACPFADEAVIVFTGGGRACSSGTQWVVSAPGNNPKVVVHETGHNAFGLADEYCCDGGYFQGANFYNIYTTLAECQADSTNPAGCWNFCPEQRCYPGTAAKITACKAAVTAAGGNPIVCNCSELAAAGGFSANDCTAVNPANCPQQTKDYWTARGINTNDLTVISPNWYNYLGRGIVESCVNGGDGWWKSDPDVCAMKSGTDYDPDCKEGVTQLLDSNFPGCLTFTARDLPEFFAPRASSLVIDLHIDADGLIITRGLRAVPGPSPRRINPAGRYTVMPRSKVSTYTPTTFTIDDPRISDLPPQDGLPPGRMVSNASDFTLVVPLDHRLSGVDIVDSETGQTVGTIDISQEVADFCAGDMTAPGCPQAAEQPVAQPPSGQPATGQPPVAGQPPAGQRAGASARGGDTAIIIAAVLIVVIVLVIILAVVIRRKKKRVLTK